MSLRLQFFGAAGEVTGSCTLVESGSARVLVDFGLHQGSASAEVRNRRLPPLRAESLDAVVLTHAHIDHCGRLPLLVRSTDIGGAGYRGKIWATPATIDLAAILLRDAAYLQEQNANRLTASRRRRGASLPVTPLYTAEDAERVLQLFRPLPYGTEQEIAPGVSIRFVDAGHILGSASVLMRVKPREGAEKAIAFSGDLGPRGTPLLQDPVMFESADVVVLESTYGDRNHRSLGETIEEFVSIMKEAQSHDGKVLIPAFAVGRTQSLIYHLGRLKRDKILNSTPVYIDSPMAVETTDLYRRHNASFDEEAMQMLARGESPLNFKGLNFVRSVEESRRLNMLDCCAIIISASGMCTGGRIIHHLRHSLWKADTHVLIVGYQANGTLGRKLVEGAKRVNIMNEAIAVKARIHTLGGFSAHTGQAGLLEWIKPLAGGKPRVILNHGEAKPREALATQLASRHNLKVELPQFHQSIVID